MHRLSARPLRLLPHLSPHLSPRLPSRSAWQGLAALLAVGAVAGGSQALAPGLIWPASATVPSEPLKLGAEGLVLPNCLPNLQSPEMREWVRQHPKSARGRLDHRRTALQARG